MDQYPAQPAEETPVVPESPFKKYLPFILAGILILLLISGGLLLFSPSSTDRKAVPTPTVRPTATPFPPPTLPMVTKPVATTSATISPAQTGRLIFIKNGDIYNSDFATFSLFLKNATPAADKLSWSPNGDLLAWRTVSQNATPSSLGVYNRKNKTTFAITPSSFSELADYAWSPDEKQLALLYHDQSFHIGLFPLSSSVSAQLTQLVNRGASIRQIVWPNESTIIFSGEDGIISLDTKNPIPKQLVNNTQVLKMKLSPDKTKLLYSLGTDQKSDLYIINTDGSNNRMIVSVPGKVDMGGTNLPATVLDKGFIPYALWFPDGSKLMVGYHYLTNLPLAGIYDLTNNSFTALTPFSLYDNDFMVDDLRLMGARVNLQGNIPSWQVAFFTLEDNAKLATVRVIPDASSPAFFGDDLLPSGNTF